MNASAKLVAVDPLNTVQAFLNNIVHTGRMNTEDLARTHLGVDLTQPGFWEKAVDRALADVDEFVALARQVAE